MTPTPSATPSSSMGPSALPALKDHHPDLKRASASPSNGGTGASAKSSSPASPEPRGRHRPPMLNLDNGTSAGGQSNGTAPTPTPAAKVNLANITRNTATATTTLLGASSNGNGAATPSSSMYPALRTPKDIVLQDIAVQCISPALPSFGSSVLDVMARSKSIQEEQRRLIAQRRMDDDNQSHDSSNSPEPKKDQDQDSAPKMSNVIVSGDGDLIIETVPTPTEAHLDVSQLHRRASLKPSNRKPRPTNIELFPFHPGGPSIHSAPLRRAPYSPNSLANTGRRVMAAKDGAVGAPASTARAPMAGGAPGLQARKQRLPPGHHYVCRGHAAPMTALPGGNGWPGSGSAAYRPPLQPAAEADEDEDEDDEEDDGRDPEDAALSDEDNDVPPRSAAAAAAKDKALRSGFTNAMQTIVDSAAATAGNGQHNKRTGGPHHRDQTAKKQRFMELCSELWDVFRS